MEIEVTVDIETMETDPHRIHEVREVAQEQTPEALQVQRRMLGCILGSKKDTRLTRQVSLNSKRRQAKKPNIKLKGTQDIRKFFLKDNTHSQDNFKNQRSSELGQARTGDCTTQQL